MESHRNRGEDRPLRAGSASGPQRGPGGACGREAAKAERKGYRVVFLAVFTGALMAEALLFMCAQMREIALILKEDFRIIVVKSGKAGKDPAAMEESLKALPGTKNVVFVPKAEALKRLKGEAPDLTGVVSGMGLNPLPDTFEAELEEAALGNVNSWAERAWKIPGVADIKYKPLEANVVLHALFYGHYISVVLVLAFFSLVMTALTTVAYRNSPANFLESVKRDRNWFFAGLAAASAAAALSYALVYPVKHLSPLWVWPGPLSQASLLAAGGAAAWVIFQWKNTHYPFACQTSIAMGFADERR